MYITPLKNLSLVDAYNEKNIIGISSTNQGVSVSLTYKAGKPIITSVFINSLPIGLFRCQYLFNLSVGNQLHTINTTPRPSNRISQFNHQLIVSPYTSLREKQQILYGDDVSAIESLK